MTKNDVRICPCCGRKYEEYPALSRRDNKTEICPACGTLEALADYYDSKKTTATKSKETK